MAKRPKAYVYVRMGNKLVAFQSSEELDQFVQSKLEEHSQKVNNSLTDEQKRRNLYHEIIGDKELTPEYRQKLLDQNGFTDSEIESIGASYHGLHRSKRSLRPNS